MQKNIHIDNIERTFAKTGNEKFVLISGKDKYQFFGTEKGEDSLAKKQFNQLGVHPDMDIQVEYLEEPETFTGKDGNVVNWTKRSVRGIFPADGPAQPSMTPHQERLAQSNPLYDKPKVEPKTDKFWEQQAYEKCCSLWIASALQRESVTPQDIVASMNKGAYWDIFQAIKADGKKRFFDFTPGSAGGKGMDENGFGTPADLPTIQVTDITLMCSNCGQVGATFEDNKHDCIPF